MSRRKRLRFEPLEPRQLLAADFQITEFVASNSRTILDEDGEDSDWIEIANLGTSEGSLAGWHLTDDHDRLDKWQFPDVSLAADARIVVWASNKNRSAVSGPLHTNFKLSSGGEYLGLVQPDSSTVVSEFFPNYPQQFTDISYGLSEAGPLSGQFRYFANPSPGQSNAAASADVAPFLTNLSTDSNGSPADHADIVVTVEAISQGAPISSVNLHYVVMFGAEKTLQMFDDGTNGDAQANDGIFTAIIPNTESKAGDMVRFYATASADGDSARLPRFSSSKNQQYEGVVIADPSVSSNLPVFQWFVENPNWFRNPRGGNNKNPTTASLFYNGEFYDNLSVEVKGNASSQNLLPKFKFTLPKDKNFQWAEGKAAVKKFDLQSGYQDPSFVRNVMGFELFRQAGALAPDAFHVHTRMNGQFYELGIYIERIDEYFLQNHGLSEDDAVYKADGIRDSQGNLLPAADLSSTAGFEKKNRDDIDPTFSELEDLIAGVSPSNPNRMEYLMDNVNLPEVISALAVYALVKHYDSTSQNYYLHRDSDGTGRWSLIAWDMDLIWDRLSEPLYGRYFSGHPFTGSSSIPTWTNAHWNRLYDAIFDVPETQEMFLRRLRSLMDEYLQPPSTPVSQRGLESRAAELAAIISPEALADYAKWRQQTGPAWGNVGPLPNGIAHLNSKLNVRRNYLYGLKLIPAAQPATFPVDFGDIDSHPESGNQDEEYIELKNPNPFAIDISDWKLTEGVTHTFAKGTVIPAHSSLYVVRDENAFRNRDTGPRGGQGLLMQGNYVGEIAFEGETLNLLNASGNLVRSFDVPKVNLPPTIQPLADQTIDQASATAPIDVIVNDPDTAADQLVYTATVVSALYQLDQELNLSVPQSSTGGATYYPNFRGSNERYLTNNQGTHPKNQWYYILPTGDLYLFTGNAASTASSSLQGTWIANVGTDVYQDPTLLASAVSPSGNATFHFAGTSSKTLVITPAPHFVGDLTVMVSVSDGRTTRSTPLTLHVQERVTHSPVLDAIGPQTASSGTTLTVDLSVSDPDTPVANLQFSASSESPLVKLDEQLNLSKPASANYYFNFRGSSEKYLTNPTGSAANRWYYVLPDGTLFRFTGNVSSSSPASLTGVFIATVGTEVYDSPALLHSPSSNASPFEFTFTGSPVSAMTISIPPDFVGTSPVTVIVSDGLHEVTQTFNVTVTPTPPGAAPELATIPDQSLASGASSGTVLTVDLTVSDPDTPAADLQFSASSESPLVKLDEQLNLSKPASASYYFNYRGSNEKYLTNPTGSAANRWYYVLPDGDLFRFTGNVSSSSPASLTGVFIATVGTEVYDNPALLHSPSSNASPFEFAFTGTPVNAMTITIPPGFIGTSPVTLIVSDGVNEVTQSFNLTVTPTPPGATPELATIPDQSLASGATKTVALTVSDDDTAMSLLQYAASVRVTSSSAGLDIPLAIPSTGRYAAYYQNFRGSQEKYLVDPNGVHPNRWYFIMPNDSVYRFTGNETSSSPASLTGVKIGTFAGAYADPTRLINGAIVHSPIVTVVGGDAPSLLISAPEDFVGTAEITVTVSDGTSSSKKTFELTVQEDLGPFNAAPELAPLANQTVVPGGSVAVVLSATDADDPISSLTFTASAVSLAGQLNTSLNLTKPSPSSSPAYYQNFRGSNEKYLLNPNGVAPNRWYYLLPNGDFYRFTGNPASSAPASLTGVFLTNLGPGVYQNPADLHEATLGITSLNVSFSGSPTTLATIAAEASFNTPAVVSISVSDGSKSDTKSFELRPTATAAGEAIQEPTVEVQWQAQNAAVALSIFGDPQLAESIPSETLSRANILDVNGKDGVTALDALQIINFLNNTSEMERGQAMIDAILTSGMVLDTNGDGAVTALDALLVINGLNQRAVSSAEPLSDQASAVDQVHASPLSDLSNVDKRDDDLPVLGMLF